MTYVLALWAPHTAFQSPPRALMRRRLRGPRRRPRKLPPLSELLPTVTLLCPCGEPFVACAPGGEGEAAVQGNLFVLEPEVPMQVWCAGCWPWGRYRNSDIGEGAR